VATTPPADPAPVLAVLLAEHEPEVAEMARRYLTRAGAAVTMTTGADGTTAALAARTADVAVLDLTMPGLDARRVRRLLSEPSRSTPQSRGTPPHRLPTLFLLAASMRPRDLRIAAESCLWRPFSPRLLVSRVLAVAPQPALGSARRPAPAPAAAPAPARVPVPAVPLTPSESALLSALAGHPGHVLSRSRLQTILSRSTPGHPASGRAIDVHVSQLRAKLPDPGLIRTVRGVGYILDEADQTGTDAPGE
jgi:two-component system, OmpR family, response regulator